MSDKSYAIAAAWFEAECLTRRIRIDAGFSKAIIAKVAEAGVAIENLESGLDRTDKLQTETHRQAKLARLLQDRANEMVELIQAERGMPLWRRALRWATRRPCA